MAGAVCLLIVIGLALPAHANSSSLGPAVPAPSATTDDGDPSLSPQRLLNRRRTGMSLLLYAQVLAEMLSQDEKASQGLLAWAREKIDSGFNAKATAAEQSTCIADMVAAWSTASETGDIGSTREIIQVLQGSAQTRTQCRRWLDWIVGDSARQRVHGQFLSALEQIEGLFSLEEQKRAHLSALAILINQGGSQYFAAAQAIDMYYMEDRNPAIRSLARNHVRDLPTQQDARAFLNVVNPDNVTAAFGVGGLLSGLLSGLSAVAPAAVSGAVGTLGLHAGAVSAALEVSREKKGPIGAHAVRGQVGVDQRSILAKWIENLRYDLPTLPLLTDSAERIRRRFLSHGSESFDLLPFLAALEVAQMRSPNLFLTSNRLTAMQALSRKIREALQKADQSFEQRLREVRKLAIESSAIRRYRGGQPLFLPMLYGDGGNCVANTQMMLALLWPHRDLFEPGWKLGIETFPDHVQPVLYSAEQGRVIDLVGGQRKSKIKNAIFHPAVFFEGFLRQTPATARDWKRYLLAGPDDKMLVSYGRDRRWADTVLTSQTAGSAGKFIDLPPALSPATNRPAPAFANLEFREIFDSDVETQPPSDHAADTSLEDESGVFRRRLESPRDLALSLNPDAPEKFGPTAFKLEVRHTNPGHSLDGKVKTKRLNTVLQIGSDEVRDQLESLPSDEARTERLEQLLRGNIREVLRKTKLVVQLLANPTATLPSVAGEESFFDPVFDLSWLLNQAQALETYRLGKTQTSLLFWKLDDFDADRNESPLRIENIAMAWPEFRELLQLNSNVFRAIARSPELALQALDSQQVPMLNRYYIYRLYVRNLRINSNPQATPKAEAIRALLAESHVYRHELAKGEAADAFNDLLRDQRRVGISEQKTANSASLAQLQKELPIDSKYKVASQRLRIVDLRQNQIANKISPCPKGDPSGRCREQAIVYLNPHPAKIYVSPETFFTVAYSSHVRAAEHWSRTLENTFLATYASTVKSEIAQTLASGQLPPAARFSPTKLNLRAILGSLMYKYEDEGSDRVQVELRQTPRSVIWTSRILAGMFGCEKALEQAQRQVETRLGLSLQKLVESDDKRAIKRFLSGPFRTVLENNARCLEQIKPN